MNVAGKIAQIKNFCDLQRFSAGMFGNNLSVGVNDLGNAAADGSRNPLSQLSYLTS